MTDTTQDSRAKRVPLPDGTSAIIARLRAHEDTLRDRGVTTLTLFGSRVRGDERTTSDLDILIDYDRNRQFTLYDLVRIKRYLSRLVGLKAHVVTREGFPPDRLRRLLKDSVAVF